ncbi:622_t:CDS:1, partial [Funneliformis geosporum]
NLRYAKLSNVCLLVVRSWEAIDNEIVIKSFKTCRILIHLDSDLEITDKKDEDEVSDKDINSDDN